MKRLITVLLTLPASIVMAMAMPMAAKAATTVVVTPANPQGWSTGDSTAGGSVNYIYDADSPLPSGALQLLTDNTTSAKAQYVHATDTALANVTELSYSTKQVLPNGTVADPSYQLAVCLTGAPTATTCPGFTTLVYEPYQGGQGTVTNNVWQDWNVADGGLFWSTRTVACSNGTLNGTAGGPATYTLADVKAACPNAVVAGYGVNIGSNNANYNVETDQFNFNGTTYDFQLNNTPTSKDQCKDGGYANFTDENGVAFKNQGQCVAYANRGARVVHKNINTVNVHNNNNQTAFSGNARSSNNTNGGNAQSGNANNSNTTNNNVSF